MTRGELRYWCSGILVWLVYTVILVSGLLWLEHHHTEQVKRKWNRLDADCDGTPEVSVNGASVTLHEEFNRPPSPRECAVIGDEWTNGDITLRCGRVDGYVWFLVDGEGEL